MYDYNEGFTKLLIKQTFDGNIPVSQGRACKKSSANNF